MTKERGDTITYRDEEWKITGFTEHNGLVGYKCQLVEDPKRRMEVGEWMVD